MKIQILSLVLLMQLCGCTAVLSGITKTIPRKMQTVEGSQFEKAEKGLQAVFTMKDSTQHRGSFRGVEFEPYDIYSARYKKWHKQKDTFGDLPLPEDSISVILNTDSVLVGEFKGFDRGRLYLSLERGGYGTVVFDEFATLRTSKQVEFSKDDLQILLRDETAQLRTQLVLSDKGNKVEYHNPEEVLQIRYGKNYGFLGFAVGLFLDVIIVSAAAIKSI